MKKSFKNNKTSKKNIKFISLMLCLCFFVLTGCQNSDDPMITKDKTFEYEYTDDGNVSITKYIGTGGDVIIPNEIDGKAVTEIGGFDPGIFQDYTNLTSIIIPEGVITIWDNSFTNCTGLTSVTIPSSVIGIGHCAFEDCINLSSIYFEGNAPSIGNYVFVETPANLTFYYREGTSDWTNPWHGRLTKTY